jgi:hypothetical protein
MLLRNRSMDEPPRAAHATALLPFMFAYGAASLLHFAHNAFFVAQYPNLPRWLSPLGIGAAWLGVTAVGLAGYLLLRRNLPAAGLAFVALYAALGFAGLDHYALAPIAAHTPVMNLTIWLEVAAAAVLLLGVACRILARSRLARAAVGSPRG